jgi:hypothetical protein
MHSCHAALARRCCCGGAAVAMLLRRRSREGAAAAALSTVTLPRRRYRGNASEAAHQHGGVGCPKKAQSNHDAHRASERVQSKQRWLPPRVGKCFFREASNYENEQPWPRRALRDHDARRAATKHKISTQQALPLLRLCWRCQLACTDVFLATAKGHLGLPCYALLFS